MPDLAENVFTETTIIIVVAITDIVLVAKGKLTHPSSEHTYLDQCQPDVEALGEQLGVMPCSRAFQP